MSGPPHRGCLFREPGGAPPAWLKALIFIQRDVQRFQFALAISRKEGCENQPPATALLALRAPASEDERAV